MTLTRINTNSITDGSIVNADISASAAIAGTKISPDFGSQNIVTTGGLTVDTNTLVVDALNNRVGIGSTPSSLFHISGSVAVATIEGTSTTSASIQFRTNSNNRYKISTPDSSADLAFYAGGSDEAMRLDSSKRLLVGTTTSTQSGADRQFAVLSTGFPGIFRSSGASAGNETLCLHNDATSGDNVFLNFKTDGAGGNTRGTIDYNRAGGLTRYNTTSDYRAKNIIGPVNNSGQTIDGLKIYEALMKGATQSRPMLVAHEAQQYVPYAVSGEKDETYPDGSPKYQQVDVSSLVPLLIAEIQQLRARVAALEAQ